MLRNLLIAIVMLGAAAPVVAAPLQLQVEDARIVPDQVSGSVQLQVELAPDSVRALTKFTSRHVGDMVEMWVGGKLVMSPTIQTVIVDGSIMISGDFTHDELDRMADQINANETAIELVVP